MSKPRLFLIDGYSNIFRAFYAIRGLTSSKGEPTNAVYGFHNMLRKLLREEDPELVGVAWDVGGPTVRSERFAEYKANRAPTPEDLKPQLPWIRRLLEAYRIPILELRGYEADDVLGSLAIDAAEAGYEVTLVSADKDLMQLVRPGISLYHTGREKLYDAAGVEEDFGVPPERVVDVLALTGDSVDNVPGVPGIGKKGAPDLIREYGSLEALLERAEEVPRKSYREGLLAHRESALLSRELVTIHTDIDVPFDPASLRREEPDVEALREVFARLEFFSLLEELTTTREEKELPRAREIIDREEVERALSALGPEVDLLAVGAFAVRGLALHAGDDAPVWIDFRRPGLRDVALERLRGWLEDDATVLRGHDLKEVLRLAGDPGGSCCRLEDVMVHAYLLNPALKGYSLPELALEGLQHKVMSRVEAGWKKGEEPLPGDAALLAFAGERLTVCRELAERYRGELTGQESLARVYREIEAPLIPVLVAMEEEGIGLDVELLRAMSRQMGAELHGLEREIFELAGEEFNLSSPRQLGEILFEKLDYPVIKKTRKTKSASTDAETLEELAERGYDLPERLLRYRELSKLKSTYVDALPQLVAADGRLHTRFHQAVAATGRLSSAEPNLQNIPVREGQGREIRKAFVAPEGRSLLVADYSQIELRVLAHIAQEEAMIAAFRQGLDIHAATAARVFGVAPDLVGPDQRRAAKVINFGIVYGMTPFGLAKTLRVTPGDAKRFIEAYLDRYPGVRRYTEETLAMAEETGKVETLYGRARWVPELRSRNYMVRENGKRMAINARIQGTAADLLKLAMIAVHRRLRAESPETRLLLTVHDELVFETPTPQVQTVARWVEEEMVNVAELDVPLVAEAGWGPSWYDAKG
jgi:DNA polymerase-1